LQTVKNLARLALFLMLVLLLVEFSYRFYVLGFLGFDLARTNSMTTLMRSEYVQPAKYPDLFYELKPDMQGWFKGVRFWTNSEAQPDKDYSRTKPVNTFRIAIAGSSWEMPSGVEPDQAWHALLEADANSGKVQQSVEVINFGVEMYGLREILGTVRHKIVAWDPDLVVVAVTPYTMSLVWPADELKQSLPPRAYPAFDFYALLAIKHLLHMESDTPANDRERFGNDQQVEQMAQLRRAIQELGAISEQIDVPIAVVFLGFYPFDDYARADIQQQIQEAGISTVFANGIFPQDNEEMAAYQVSLFDRHPNKAGHELIAAYVSDALRAQQLLPAHH
jgi:hypothetical protein